MAKLTFIPEEKHKHLAVKAKQAKHIRRKNTFGFLLLFSLLANGALVYLWLQQIHF